MRNIRQLIEARGKNSARWISSKQFIIGAALVLAGLSVAIFSGIGNKVEAQGGGPSPSMVDPNLAVRRVASGLVTPTTMAFIGENDFFVLEKNTGRVRRVADGAVQEAPVLDLAVNNFSERGLLGIALHPDFGSNGFVYLYWSWRGSGQGPNFPDILLGPDTNSPAEVYLTGNRVDRFHWDGSTLAFDQNIIQLRAFQADPGQPIRGNHNGGIIRFGPDGKLYIIVGDVGRRGWMQNNLQGPVPDDQFGGPEPDLLHLTGVILRLNDDGTAPQDNPFFNLRLGDIDLGNILPIGIRANIQKVFAYGVRNSFGMMFDPTSGQLWTSENGDDSFGEINRVEAGFDGGWVQIMGPVGRIRQFKEIEMTLPPSGGQPGAELQQIRWPATRIADTPEQALRRLFRLPGSRYTDPEFSWKFEVSPSAVGFGSSALGPQFEGSMFVGAASPVLAGGYLFHFKLTDDRRNIASADRRLADRVADNLRKNEITESESLLVGRNFGVVTDIQTAPNGNLFVVSLSQGAVYEVFASEPDFATELTGAEEVPAVDTPASGQAAFSLSADGTQLNYRLEVSDIDNVVAAHIHVGPRGVNGSVVAFLYGDVPPGGGRSSGVLARGTITAADLRGPLAGQPLSALIEAMRAGNTYANVHTNDGVPPPNTGPGDSPGGEIRGQISPLK